MQNNKLSLSRSLLLFHHMIKNARSFAAFDCKKKGFNFQLRDLRDLNCWITGISQVPSGKLTWRRITIFTSKYIFKRSISIATGMLVYESIHDDSIQNMTSVLPLALGSVTMSPPAQGFL